MAGQGSSGTVVPTANERDDAQRRSIGGAVPYCRDCGLAVEEADNFCERCGRPRGRRLDAGVPVLPSAMAADRHHSDQHSAGPVQDLRRFDEPARDPRSSPTGSPPNGVTDCGKQSRPAGPGWDRLRYAFIWEAPCAEAFLGPGVSPAKAQREARYRRRLRIHDRITFLPAAVLALWAFFGAGTGFLAMLWVLVVGGYLWFMAWTYDDRLPETQRSRRILAVGAATTVAAVALHQHNRHHAERMRECRAQDDLHALAQAARHHGHGRHHHRPT